MGPRHLVKFLASFGS